MTFASDGLLLSAGENWTRVTWTFAVTDSLPWIVDGTDYLQAYTLFVDVQTLIRGWEVVVEVTFVFGPVLQSRTFLKQ